jgi:hypothetical protein
MSKWIPKNQEEANKRAAGRRKLNIRRRKARAERITALLSDMLGGEAQYADLLRAGGYGATRITAESFEVSETTAGRDLCLCRWMLEEFRRARGREFDPGRDEITWSWDYSQYSFKSRESFFGKRIVTVIAGGQFSTRPALAMGPVR